MHPTEERDQEEQDIIWMRYALSLAQKAFDMGEVPVGAVIVQNNTLLAGAHNLRETRQDPTAHAETLAIKEAAQKIGSWRLEACTLYVTLEPCPMCAGSLWLSRIPRCVFGCRDPRAGYLGSIANLMDHTELNHHYTITSGVLEKECSEILRTFFRRIREEKTTKRRHLQ